MDSVFVVPVFEKWLLHAPLHGVSALVNTATLNALKTDGAANQASFELIDTLKNGPIKPEFLGIIPTRSCNLNCAYCGFHPNNNGNSHMNLSLAVSAVDWMAEQVVTSGDKHLDIHFFGGEPFCAPDVVDVVVHRARILAAENGLTAHFEADTNGFFDEMRCQFVGDYINSVVLSFDGPQEIHNLHRPAKNGDGSFEVVARNAYQLSQAPCELSFRVCVTQKNVRQLEEITRWFSGYFHPTIINFEPLKPTPESEAAGLQSPDPFEFALNFMKARFAASKVGIQTIYSGAMIEKIQHSACPVGRDAVIVSPDGKLNACYLLQEEWMQKQMDLSMGEISHSGKMNLDTTALERIRNYTLHKKRCQTCIARWHCAGGCHVSNFEDNQTDCYTHFCTQTRAITTMMILEELGAGEELLHLLHDKNALKKLAFHQSDCISHWEP